MSNHDTMLWVIAAALALQVALIGVVLYKGHQRELNARKREHDARNREMAFQAFRIQVLGFFESSKEYFNETSTIHDMIKANLQFTRSSNTDAAHAAESTTAELHQISQQTAANAQIVSEKTEELKNTIPLLTVEKLKESVNMGGLPSINQKPA